MNYRIYPPEEMMLEADITLPLSKSISNRALILNALTIGALPLNDIAQCDDTDVMVKALSSTDNEINIGAAGTAMRFLTAFYASEPDKIVTLDGSERMRHRPIKALVDALRQCGAEIEYLGEEVFPPLKITGKKLTGGNISLPASISSQYISALLMIAPTMQNGLTLTLDGEIISRPYITMTLSMMRDWGMESDFSGNIITIKSGCYTPVEFSVEADWSAASYWYEIEALSSGDISLKGLKQNSYQGDSQLAKIFERLGIFTHYDNDKIILEPSPDSDARLTIDMSEQPDLAQTVAVTCCMLGIPFHIKGLSTLRIKETDRLEALRKELDKLSFTITIEHDSELIWDGERHPIFEEPAIDTYDDHRMAMAFAPVAIYAPGLLINNIEVVSKSYPGFWNDLQQAGFKLVEA